MEMFDEEVSTLIKTDGTTEQKRWLLVVQSFLDLQSVLYSALFPVIIEAYHSLKIDYAALQSDGDRVGPIVRAQLR
jgi:hypothetical protein